MQWEMVSPLAGGVVMPHMLRVLSISHQCVPVQENQVLACKASTGLNGSLMCVVSGMPGGVDAVLAVSARAHACSMLVHTGQ